MKRNIPSYFLLAFLGIWLSVSGVAISQTITNPSVGAVSAENTNELKSLIKTLEDDAYRLFGRAPFCSQSHCTTRAVPVHNA